MKHLKQLSAAAAMLLSLVLTAAAGCSSPALAAKETPSTTPVQVIHNLSAAEAYALIQANNGNPDFIIIDVRTPAEYATGHLENTINIDYTSANFKQEISKQEPGRKYLVYCRSGARSAQARDVMKTMGFLGINNMDGGITAWTAAGFQVVK